MGSLETKGGSLRWGHNINIGTYAQHVYTSIDPNDTVLEYLEYQAMPGTTDQQVLAVAGSLLFRDEHVHKKVKVLSGGERARLCMAGLLLGDYNVLVLDEPGNHLDVETVEALAESLLAYQGTVIFTSHDRHFMNRVATTVIEVGVNVPNASVMIIESAERFGLSQLHQLRGRVGRGAEQSFCILITGYKISAESKQRMDIMVETNDGFRIAEVDLKMRGPGNVEGTQQSGITDLKLANLAKDSKILAASSAAKRL